jgi:beta-galactosidase GanA
LNRIAVTLVVLWSAVHGEAAEPRLVKHGDATQLVVQGKPLLVLGGELSNSAASSAQYMAPHWPRLKAMHLNTVLAPVSWELIEPAEGHFDWRSVDDLIAGARANDLKLVLLWFGAWKNSMSTYAPAWVKRNTMRFPRAMDQGGHSLDILSAFSPATRDADKRAFTSLLGHIRSEDQERNTVLMVQVENEIGMLTAPRDLSREASARFHEAVPSELMHALDSTNDSYVRRLWQESGGRRAGDWPSVFGAGEGAAEVFSAWYYARYVESLVVAGKAVYPLPMYVNAALNRKGKHPGDYPSGGPLPHLLDVWKTAAPSLDLIAPDIYFPSFVEIAARYRRTDNPLFIPEANYADRGEFAANAFYALGKLDAIGIAPFSVDSVDDPPTNRLSMAYQLLTELTPLILANQGLHRMSAFRPDVLEDGTVLDASVTEAIGDYRFTVSFVDTQSPPADQALVNHGVLIVQLGPEEYLMAGQGVIITFAAAGDPASSVGIESDWEGRFADNGTWLAGRLLNGDQTHQGRHVRLAPDALQIQRVKLYRYR